MIVADRIISFCESLNDPIGLPKDVEIMNPYKDVLAKKYAFSFYRKYYNDANKRIVLFGINPGRFGGGITGVPFTDPKRLEEDCDIKNPFDKRQELSSRFIYDVIDAFGGPDKFYSKYYISALSPLGFTANGKNLNYYDIKGYQKLFEEYALERIREQMGFVLSDVAFCIGQGTNLKFLNYLNEKYGLFERIETVPHPRWVMQYRLKRKQEFIGQYISALNG